MLEQREGLQPVPVSDLKMLEQAVAKYETAGAGARELRDFLVRRKISAETAATFRLGYVAEPVPGHDKYQGMLAIPYLLADGQVAQVRFRCLADHDCKDKGHGKYMTVSGDTSRMFNVPALVGSEEELHVTEGEVDTMTLTQLGLAAVAMPGATNWRRHHAVMCAGFNRVWIWGDGDDAGRRFASDVRQSVSGSVAIRVPEGQDVNSIFVEHGEAGVMDLLQEFRELYS